jgi:hypothetical protein
MMKKQLLIYIVLLFITFFSQMTSFGAEEGVKSRTSYFNEDWLKTVVSLEVITENGKAKPIGTGFLIESPNKHIILITAKHVILDESGRILQNLAYRLNDKEGKSIILTDEHITKLRTGSWFLSENNDVACRFILRKKTSDVINIPLSIFLVSKELNIGAPLVILGFPLGLRSEDYAIPIARKAMVARADPKLIIVDGFVFPGNSGGPVIYLPSVLFGKGITPGVLNEQRVVGLVSESINSVEIAISPQTKRPRISFEDNTGLANVIPSEAILELINSTEVSTFDKSLKSD